LTQPQLEARAVSPSVVLLSDWRNRSADSRAMRRNSAPIAAADSAPNLTEFAGQSGAPIFLAAAEVFW